MASYTVNSKRDGNYIPVIMGISNVDQVTPVMLAAAPSTGHLQVDASIAAATSGGWTPVHYISAASNNATVVKNTPGQIGGWALYNNSSSIRYVKLYNKATAPSVGTDTPLLTILVPGNANGAGSNLTTDAGLVFSTGIGFGTTTGIADNDTGTVTGNDLAINWFYI